MRRTFTLGTCLAGLLALTIAASPASPSSTRLPRRMLWAWERPERFPSLPPDVGVAYLAGTLFLEHERVVARPRMQPLVIAPRTPLLAVVRIETSRTIKPLLTDRQAQQSATETLALARGSGALGLQVDYDARVAERPFYARLLAALRRDMPPEWRLSITALASWCLGDPWIRRLPIDEAVPMLFQMGPDGREVLARLAAGQDFSLPVCRQSLGLSMQEPLGNLPAGRRRYIFTAGSWSGRAIADAARW